MIISVKVRRKNMNFLQLDTPALLIDKDIMLNNLKHMQDYANEKSSIKASHQDT